MAELFLKAEGLKTLFSSESISFSVYSGDVVCLFGMNGSGKTLLIKTLCGIFTPCSGNVTYVIDNSRRGVCLQFPEHLVFKETVYEEAFLITGSEEKAKKLLNEVGVLPDQSPFFMSDGQKRLLFLYGYLETKDLLLFDEPFASLDKDTQNNVYNKINEAARVGKSIIYTANRRSHIFSEAKIVNITKNS